MKTTKLFITKHSPFYVEAVFQTQSYHDFKNTNPILKELDRVGYNSIAKVYLELLSSLLKLYDSTLDIRLDGHMMWDLTIYTKTSFDIDDFVNIINTKQIIVDNLLLEIIIDDDDFTTRDRL